MEFSMIVLAGGKSSRMGRDKSDLLLGMDTFLNGGQNWGSGIFWYPVTAGRTVRSR